MFNESCSIIIVAHNIIIAKLVVDPDLAAGGVTFCSQILSALRYFLLSAFTSELLVIRTLLPTNFVNLNSHVKLP